MHQSSATALQDDRFLLLGALGCGGMATVYRAFDRVEQQLVALKVHSEEELAGPSHPLSAEFDAWSRLKHPNIVCAYEMVHSRQGPLAPGTPYLVLEHVAGGSVSQLIRPGRLQPDRLEQLAVEVLSGLAHIHGRGWLHRDLKPANLLVDSSARRAGRVKLTDFGLATPTGTSEEPGTISGSFPYVSPESLLGLPLDGRTDLYGLGVLLYQLATGELPVPAGGPEETIRWHLAGPPADPRRRRPRFPDRLARFIQRLSARNRDERPAGAEKALAQLGVTRVPQSSRHSGPAACAARATLRLALDAARLGASRVFRLPRTGRSKVRLLHEVSVWSQVRGLGFHRLSETDRSAATELERLVLRLLLESGARSRSLVERFALQCALPLDLIGDSPLLDFSHDPQRCSATGWSASADHVEQLGSFLLDCATRRSMVLHIAGSPPAKPAIRALRGWLRDRLRGRGSPHAGRGGFLLLVE